MKKALSIISALGFTFLSTGCIHPPADIYIANKSTYRIVNLKDTNSGNSASLESSSPHPKIKYNALYRFERIPYNERRDAPIEETSKPIIMNGQTILGDSRLRRGPGRVNLVEIRW